MHQRIEMYTEAVRLWDAGGQSTVKDEESNTP